MTEIEISKALALAIGYLPEQMFQQKSTVTDDEYQMVRHANSWCCFDYKDWETIGPIAARYECFPGKSVIHKEMWVAAIRPGSPWDCEYADTPQKAIALAVIEGVKK